MFLIGLEPSWQQLCALAHAFVTELDLSETPAAATLKFNESMRRYFHLIRTKQLCQPLERFF